MLTWPSAIASSSAACVFGGVRLISSASSRLVKIGPAAEFETARLHVVDGRAEQVGGQQVGGELHAGELQAERRGEGPRDQRLAKPGKVLDQHVTAGEHRGQDQRQRPSLADHDALDLVEDRFAVGGGGSRQ